MDKRSFYLLLSSIACSALSACGGEDKDDECPHTVVLASSERPLGTTTACISLSAFPGVGGPPQFAIIAARCVDLCGDRTVTACGVDRAYIDEFTKINSFDAGSERKCPTWEPTVQLSCRREEVRGTASGYCPTPGRRPAGLMAARRREPSQVADYLARSAHLEAASVFAFDKLAEDLARLKAPHALIEECLRAAREETEHARVVGKLAKARGARPLSVDLAVRGQSSPLELALENMTEGVVRESYGAVQARFSGRTALDPRVRTAMAVIAVDEASHAWLAQRIASWLERLLTAAEREQVARAKLVAIRALRAELEEEPAAALRAELGVPSRAEALRLFAALEQRVWS